MGFFGWVRPDRIAVLAAGVIALASAPRAHAGVPATPSFDCRYAKGAAEKMVCADPALAQLDRQLAETFLATSHQGGIDGKALRRDEDHWLTDVRDRCGDTACLKDAYVARNQALLDQSLRAASPAAYDETRPFAAPPALLGEAKAFVGQSCGDVFAPASKTFPGFEPVAGFSTIISQNAYVVVRAKAGVRFAFLLGEADGDLASCKIADVVTLPPPSKANTFLQCHLDDPPSFGFGMRLAGHRAVVAYWSIDSDRQAVDRVPLGVLAADDRVRCQEPETGE